MIGVVELFRRLGWPGGSDDRDESAVTDGGASRETPREDRSDGPRSSLFHCETCDVVYIAAEKRTCSRCGTSPTEVPSSVGESAAA